jgi:hypothetical protein
MQFELWKLVLFLNILFLIYGIYIILCSPETKSINFSLYLIIFYISIILLSFYCIINDDEFIARSLFLFLIIYRLILFTLFDIYSTDMIKIIKVLMLLFIGISLYIGFYKKKLIK